MEETGSTLHAQLLENPFVWMNPERLTHLVAGENKGVGNHYIFPARARENDDLGNVLGGQRLAAAVKIVNTLTHALG